MYNPGDPIYQSFYLYDQNGDYSDAVSPPTGVLRRNGDDTNVTVDVSNLSTGSYLAYTTISDLWDIGDVVELVVTATVNVDGVNERTQSRVYNYGPLVLSVGGSGATAITLIIREDGTDRLIPDADVWLTADSAGARIVEGTKQTNAAGEVVFQLDLGASYYLWMQKDGYKAIEGRLFTASLS